MTKSAETETEVAKLSQQARELRKRVAKLEADEVLWDGMTRADFKNICTYVRRMADTLGHNRWLITVRHQHLDDDSDSMAEITVNHGYMDATLKLSRTFLDASLRARRHTIIHELAHLFSFYLWNMSSDALEEVLGKTPFHIYNEAFRIEIERMTDNLAFVLGELTNDAKDLHLLCRGGVPDDDEKEYINGLQP